MAVDPQPDQPVDWKVIAAQLASGMATEGVPGLLKAWQTASLETHGQLRALDMNLAQDIATKAGALMHELEEPFMPLMASFVAPILSGLFGAEFNAADFSRQMRRGAGNPGAQAIMEGFIKAIVGDTPDEIVPSDAGSRRIASAAVAAALESTFNAEVPEMLSHLLPFDVGHFEHLSALPENIIRALGVSRLVRRALQPVVTTCCTTPATWFLNKKHRPTLLGASTLAKQITRNPAAAEKWKEDLRREGYSEDRIEALLNEQAKFHSVADLDLLKRGGVWSDAQAIQHLRDQGYADDIARTELQIETLKRIASFERQMADAAVTAYAAGRIDEGTLGGFISGSTINAQEKAQYDELAAARRICARQPLTPSEAEACVMAGVLSVADYREALEKDNRTDDAVFALELLLRFKLDRQADIAELRKAQEAERAAEKARRDAERAERKRQIEAQRALARRGSEADLERAAVRGLIPLARVQEVYAAKYDGDTVALLMEDLAARRQDYTDQQAAADAARKRAAVRNVDVGALEQAVTTGVLTLGDFRARLEELRFTSDDADLLTATLGAKLEALQAAQAARDAAAAAAKIKHIDLGRMETLVRRGHRSLHDYDALLETLGFEEGSRAAMIELLQLRIDDDAAAAAVRAATAARLAKKGLSLEQRRRAVVLGIMSIDEYSAWLLAQGVPASDAAILVAELQIDADEAAAARARRADADRRQQAGRAPLSDVRRAARLSLIPVDAYYARLRADGYTDDDVAIESDLLVAEIARTQAAQAAADAAAAAAPGKGLTLSQLAAAVAAGEASLDDYYGRAVQLGLSLEDADTLRRTLQDTLDVTAAARRRKGELAALGADRELARADVEKAVKQGLATLEAYAAWLEGAGYAPDDAALLVALLERAISGGDGTGTTS
jgi:hypothetical protein